MTPRPVWSVTRYPSGCRGELTCSIKILHYNCVCTWKSRRRTPRTFRNSSTSKWPRRKLLFASDDTEPTKCFSGARTGKGSPEIDWQDRYFSQEMAGCYSRWLIDRSRPHGQYWLWCRVVRGRRPHCACLPVPHRHGAAQAHCSRNIFYIYNILLYTFSSLVGTQI